MISPKSILKSALAIEASVNSYLTNEISDSTILQEISNRGTELFKYIDTNIVSILKEVDPDGMNEFETIKDLIDAYNKSISRSSSSTNDNNNDNNNVDVTNYNDLKAKFSRLILGSDWSNDLRQIRWVPALVTPPPRESVGIIPVI
jgi:hypothetical protein